MIEVYETPHSPFPDFRVPDNPAAVKSVAENRSQLNNKKLTNNESINKGLNNQSIYQKSEPDGMDVMEAYTDIIKANIEYEYLLRDNPYKKDVIEESLNLIVETVSVKRKMIRIAGANYPYEVVKGKLLKLDMGHIQYVLDCMDKNATKVRNIKNYLITALYNAPNTIGNYYQSEVNHDMNGGGF